jgi:hypothetical protein
MPTLRIISRRAGFRRCGVAHPAEPTVYPDGTFTDEQVDRLLREPMLIVEIVLGMQESMPAEAPAAADPEPPLIIGIVPGLPEPAPAEAPAEAAPEPPLTIGIPPIPPEPATPPPPTRKK